MKRKCLPARAFALGEVISAAMHRGVTLEREKSHETQRRERDMPRSTIDRHDLGQQVEKRDRDYRAGAEAEQQMEFVAKPEGRDPADARGRERGRGQNQGHDRA